MQSKTLKIADLFCGAGGLSFLFYKRGHNIGLAIDFEKYSIETYKYNHVKNNSQILQMDIKNIFNEKYRELFNYDFDLVML